MVVVSVGSGAVWYRWTTCLSPAKWAGVFTGQKHPLSPISASFFLLFVLFDLYPALSSLLLIFHPPSPFVFTLHPWMFPAFLLFISNFLLPQWATVSEQTVTTFPLIYLWVPQQQLCNCHFGLISVVVKLALLLLLFFLHFFDFV